MKLPILMIFILLFMAGGVALDLIVNAPWVGPVMFIAFCLVIALDLMIDMRRQRKLRQKGRKLK